MKKRIITILIIIGIIHTILWAFNILRFYKYPTTANEPNLKQDSRFILSSLVKPERLDFICYTVKTDTSNYQVAMRLVGVPNDILEVRKGDLYVNNENIDKNLNLRKLYKAEKKYLDSIILPKINKDQLFYSYIMHEDSTLVFIDDKTLKENNFNVVPRILDKNEPNAFFQTTFKKEWNIDNFGPIVVPEGKYFVMGDNRDFSFDSRHNGFISMEDVLGTIIHIW